MGEVVQFSVSNDQTAPINELETATIVTSTKREKSGREISIDDLYPNKELRDKDLDRALEMLDVNIGFVQQALVALLDDRVIESDDYLNRSLALAPELFACRSIGDGFANTVLNIFNSLRNGAVDGLTTHQITTLNSINLRLRQKPFLTFDESVDISIDLAEAGLNTDSGVIDVVGDLLDE